MVARRSTFWETDGEGINTPDWHVDARPCPFCTVPAMSCGCPEGERITDEAHLIRGEE